MLSSLEGILVALMLALAPGTDQMASHNTMIAGNGDPTTADCQLFAEATARKNCIARSSRPADSAIAPYPSALRWLTPDDPGMPDRFQIARGIR